MTAKSKSRDGWWIVLVAGGGSVAWLAFLYWASTGGSYTKFQWRMDQLDLLTLNEIGDFFAGTLSAFAIIGLLTTIILQRSALKQANEQFNAAQIQATEAQNANYKLHLFESRFVVAQQFAAAAYQIQNDGEVTTEVRIKLADAIERSRYLYGDDFNRALKEIWEKAQRWRKLGVREKVLKRNANQGPEFMEQLQAVVTEIEAIDKWFFDELRDEKYQTIFDKYLKMPEPI